MPEVPGLLPESTLTSRDPPPFLLLPRWGFSFLLGVHCSSSPLPGLPPKPEGIRVAPEACPVGTGAYGAGGAVGESHQASRLPITVMRRGALSAQQSPGPWTRTWNSPERSLQVLGTCLFTARNRV